MVEQLPKTWKDFVGKGFFGVWRLLNGTKRRYLHGFVRLPGTEPRKLRWFWAVYASKWPQNIVNTSAFMCIQLLLSSRVAICRFFCGGKGFCGAWRHQSGTKRRYLHGLLHLPATKPCILGWFQAMYASKWPQNTVNTINTSVSRVAPDSLLPFVHPLLSQVGTRDYSVSSPDLGLRKDLQDSSFWG